MTPGAAGARLAGDDVARSGAGADDWAHGPEERAPDLGAGLAGASRGAGGARGGAGVPGARPPVVGWRESGGSPRVRVRGAERPGGGAPGTGDRVWPRRPLALRPGRQAAPRPPGGLSGTGGSWGRSPGPGWWWWGASPRDAGPRAPVLCQRQGHGQGPAGCQHAGD